VTTFGLKMEGAWKLHLYGDFRLSDPSGASVELPNVKVEGLLAVLASCRRYGAARDEIAGILWPRVGLDARRASLRQALSELRKAIGADAIESSRSHCRLSDRFVLRCDFQIEDMRDSSSFMPGHEGEWFDDNRVDSNLEEIPSVIDGFQDMLTWYSQRSPVNMFSLLRGNPALARGLEPSALLAVLNRAPRLEEWNGWTAYWLGTCEEDLDLCASLLKVALKEGRRRGDDQLTSETCLELGKVYARTGRYEEAEGICAIASDIATRSTCKTVKSNALRLRGTVLVQRSAGADGFESLRKAEDLIDDPMERAILQSGRAFFEASVGRTKEANETLSFPLQLERETGHRRIGAVCGLTQALLAAHGDDRSAAVGRLEAMLDPTKKGTVQIQVYAEELLAKLFYLAGEKGLAQGRLRKAKEGRRETRMVVTPLEARRLMVVH
jgi:hypothetical protein